MGSGPQLENCGNTTGTPPRHAINATSLLVESAFSSCIVYEPPPPTNVEPNYKPFISLAFVIILLIFGLYWGSKKPWDRHIPAQKGANPEEIAKKEAELRKMSTAEKMQKLGMTDLEEKFSRDRHWTMTILAMPFAVVEAIIGMASFATGILSVPESGNWLSAGLIVNSLLFLAGIIYDSFMQTKGYKVPSEEELAVLKEEDLPKKDDKTVAGKKAGPAAVGKPERIIGTLSGVEMLIDEFIVPRHYDLVFAEKRLVFVKRALTPASLGIGTKAPTDYAKKDLDKVLSEKRANFSIQCDSIAHLGISGIFGKTLRVASSKRDVRARIVKTDLEKANGLVREVMQKVVSRLAH